MSTSDRLTLSQAREVFGVTSMTLYLWRQGTATRAALPTEKPRTKLGEPEHAVLFDPAKVEKWAAKHGVELAANVGKVLRNAGKTAAVKRGPKPRKVVAKRASKAVEAAPA